MRAKRVKVIVSSQRKLCSAPVLVPQDGSVELVWMRWPAAATDTETRMGFRAGDRPPRIRKFRGSGGIGYPWAVDGGYGPFYRYYPPLPGGVQCDCQYVREAYWQAVGQGSHGVERAASILASAARDAARGVTA